MIRYFFDIVIDDEVTPDEEGLLLANIERARHEATLSLAEIARDQLRSTRTISRLSIVVRTVERPISEAFFEWDPKSLQ
jgi:Domain of unknown function (DUF6894)